MMQRLVNEKALTTSPYKVVCLTVDLVKYIGDVYLDKIRSVDSRRAKGHDLLHDKSKHRNQEYTDDLTTLQVEASGYVDSIASDLQLLESINKIFHSELGKLEGAVLREDITVYHQIKIEATYSSKRVEKVLHNFNLTVNMNNSYKLGFLSIIAFVLFPSDSFFSMMGVNLPPNVLGQMGLPVHNFFVLLLIAAALDFIAWGIWHFYIRRK